MAYKYPDLGVHSATGAGIDPTGAVDSSTALQALINSIPNGATLRFSGTYRVDSTLTIVDKSIVIDASAATFTRSTAGQVFSASATADVIHDVTSLTPATITEPDGSTQPGTTIALTTGSTNTGWSRGDIVKVISDDVIPGELPGSGGLERRLGQFFTVESVATGSVTVFGTPYDPMSTNIRVTRMRSAHQVKILGGTFNAPGGGFGVILCTNLVAAEVIDPKINTTDGAAVVFFGCVNHRARLVIRYAPNDPNAPKLGYGVNDISSAYGNFDVRMMRGRHAYTTASNTVATDSDSIWYYGRTFGSKVTGIATDCISSGFDTHTEAAECVFDNIVAHRCYAIVGLRGRKNKVRNASGSSLQKAIWIFSHDGQFAESWGHEIDGVVADDVASYAIHADLNSVSLVRETRPSRIRNVTVNGHATQLIFAQNAVLHIRDIRATAAATLASNAAAVRVENSVIEGSGLRWDCRENTAGTSVRFVSIPNAADTSRVLLSGLNGWLFTSGDSRMAALVNRGSAQELVQISGLELTELPTLRVSGSSPTNQLYSTDSYLEWRVQTPGANNSAEVVRLADGSLADTTSLLALVQTRSPMVALSAHCTANQTLGTLPSGRFTGQTLSIARTDTGAAVNLTVPNDNAKKIRTASGSDYVMARSTATLLTWNGAYWVQHA